MQQYNIRLQPSKSDCKVSRMSSSLGLFILPKPHKISLERLKLFIVYKTKNIVSKKKQVCCSSALPQSVKILKQILVDKLKGAFIDCEVVTNYWCINTPKHALKERTLGPTV